MLLLLALLLDPIYSNPNSSSVIAVLMKDLGASIDVNILGLALIYALQLTGLLQWTVRVIIETENNMTAVERLSTLGEIDSEAARHTAADEMKWPSSGAISIRNLKMRYRQGLELVLKGINLSIPAGAKVGICGRTGSGKSSFMLAILRIVEAEQDSVIEIDGTDIFKLGLERLRSNITIIPQDPVMFSGTIR